MYPSFLTSQAPWRTYLSFRFFFSILLCGQPEHQSPLFGRFSLSFPFFFFCYYHEVRSSGRDYCLYLKIPEKMCTSYFRWTDSWLFICQLFVLSNLNLLHKSQWITLPTLSSLIYSFCAYFLRLIIMWLLRLNLQFLPEAFPFLAMSKFSRVRFRLFVAWNIFIVGFQPIFVFWLFLFNWYLCCLYCFWWLKSVFFRVYLGSYLVVISMNRHYPECWHVVFLVCACWGHIHFIQINSSISNKSL